MFAKWIHRPKAQQTKQRRDLHLGRALRLERLEPRLALASLPLGFSEMVAASAISNATSMEIAPDGKLFVAEQAGTLEVWQDGRRLQADFFRDAPLRVRTEHERGLLGVAVDPNFSSNRYVYVYYTTTAVDAHNRVSRFQANTTGELALARSETVLMDLDPHSTEIHNGGAIHFGPDGKLYVATGDNATGSNSQSLDNLHGKMLRINANGTIPGDNPFYAQTTGKNRAIWAMGLRNPFTFSFEPATSRMFINDVGQMTWEEINQGAAGANFGWPTTEGYFDPSVYPRFTQPLFTYPHVADGSETWGCAITGGAFYNPAKNTFGTDYTGEYFFADYCGGWINRIDPATKVVTRFAADVSGVLDLDVDAAGNLYYLARGTGQVMKVFVPPTPAPQIVEPPVDQIVAPGGSATFSVLASGDHLDYQWQRASHDAPQDFADIPGVTAASYTLADAQWADNGDRFRVVVHNAAGTATSQAAMLTVDANRAPTAEILSPAPGTTYRAGDTITFAGSAADAEDGTLPAAAYSWEIRFYHNDSLVHYHPVRTFSGVTSGTFTIPATGETSVHVWYRVILSVHDSRGFTTTVQRDIYPQTVTVSLATDPPGLALTLDGQLAPRTFPSVVGASRSLGATLSQPSTGTRYNFVRWSDGGAATHTILTQSSDAGYTAVYTLAGVRAELFNYNSTLRSIPNLDRRTADVVFEGGRIWYSSTTAPWPNLDQRFADTFAARFTGYLKIDRPGVYRLSLKSDEGSKLWVDGRLVVNNDGRHTLRERSGTINLSAGYHRLRLDYFENAGSASLILLWSGPGIRREVVPISRLFVNLPTSATAAATAATRSMAPIPSSGNSSPTARFASLETSMLAAWPWEPVSHESASAGPTTARRKLADLALAVEPDWIAP